MQFPRTALCSLLFFSAFLIEIYAQTDDSRTVKPVQKNQVIASSESDPAVNFPVKRFAPIYLTASDLSIASGNPSLVAMSKGSASIPVWSLSGGTVGQSVAGLVPVLPDDCTGVEAEITVLTSDKETNPKFEDVYRVHLFQMEKGSSFSSNALTGPATRTPLPAEPYCTRQIVLESYYPVKPNKPLAVRIQREPGDPIDTFTRPTGLVMVKITPIGELIKSYTVQKAEKYNSWPVIQSIGKKLVCVYCRGTAHSIAEDVRAVYARTSMDNGKTWTPETVVANTPKFGEVTIGKGLDEKGAMLLWVRRIGSTWNHDLYRTEDGIKFTHIATPKLDPNPMQITDVFKVPGVGLMALWFAGFYKDEPTNSWGTLISKDNGATWTQNTVESKLPKAEWPTEPSAVYLGDGRILAIARTEVGGSTAESTQFQMISLDYGKTWKKTRTNIRDIMSSTPSLIFDAKTGLLSNYYYQRGRGVLRCRITDPNFIFDHPLSWPAAKAVSLGSAIPWDAGNVNAVACGNSHYLAYYSGEKPDLGIYVTAVPAPAIDGKQ
ncbi:MAG: sialidase family protein [Planctomycetia bacterium]|nr:sialidase family protein [Planctomycetia bacterium]